MSASYKYITPIPRKKVDRKQLQGQVCDLCYDFYKTMNLSEKELQKRLDCCSRHRGPKRPPTPEHYWELDFPNDEECKKRGYCDEPKTYIFKKENRYSRIYTNDCKRVINEKTG